MLQRDVESARKPCFWFFWGNNFQKISQIKIQLSAIITQTNWTGLHHPVKLLLFFFVKKQLSQISIENAPQNFLLFWFLLWISKRSFTVICAMFDLCDTRNTSTLQYMKLLFHLRNIAGLELLLFFPSVCLKMLLTRLTVGWAAFQLAVYCGVSLNNQTTQVKCLQSFKHFILRASLGNRQAKKIK